MVARLFLTAMLLSGCTTAKGSFCAVSNPIRLSDAAVDALSDEEVRLILAQNEKGAALCKWRP